MTPTPPTTAVTLADRPPGAGADVASAGLSAWEERLLRLRGNLRRRTRWEFWPAWAIYGPLLPWIFAQGLRHDGLAVFTSANPAFPLGGLVGESKWDILSRLPPDAIVPTALLAPGLAGARERSLRAVMDERGWHFPLILKPDVGERGSGVRLVRDAEQARHYLDTHAGAVLAQTYDPGPFEAGVFYFRRPDSPHGTIFSITDKHFPSVVGDGRSSLAALVLRHPRLRMQAGVFLDRLGRRAARVPGARETVPLAVAGNHCQGTMFRDGAHLITRELTAAMDRIAAGVQGFHFGRFDVRYSSVPDFKAGRALRVVELNGVLSEATNIYDPDNGFWSAQRTLREQWRLAYEIGAANRARGHAPATVRDVLRAVRAHLARADHDARAD